MFLTRVVFGSPLGSDNKQEELLDHVQSYLASMMKTGQICGDYYYAWHKGILTVYTNLARPDAHKRKHHSKWGKQYLSVVEEMFGKSPAWELIEDVNQKRFPAWQSANALYMFTHAFDETSPVCRMDNGSPIPAYLLPISDVKREEVYSWKEEYRDHDRIWLGSGKLEMPAYKQLADPRSELASSGRGLCRLIEENTGKKTYYFLFRYYGRRKGEEDRSCPECGKPWLRKENLAKDLPFWQFPFRCDKCRLVSHIAASNDDERHARIGEYSSSLKKRTPKQ